MKTVISVRLSDERLRQLDETCRRLKMNRSEVIDAALRVLPELISDTAELKYDPSKLQGKTTEQ
jgi:metal-responsive CopG/Arc/MetJ family transcriptional regulator